MYYKYPISDVHIHAFNRAFADETLDMVRELGYAKFVMLSGASIFPEFMGNNILCAAIKLKSSGRGYAFAALHYPEEGISGPEEMLAQAARYHELGFDGIKMMDGKPNMRLRIGVPLNDPAYDPLFSFMESVDLPLLYHVNDPVEFWTWDLMPQWAKKMGKEVFYGDGRYPSKQQIEDEALGILDKHPRLRVIFPHFFFTAVNRERTRRIFDAYPNVSYDLTPGWEMFESFAQDYEGWRQFFIDYSHRILFGTDTISDHWRETVSCLRRVLETAEEFTAFEEHCRGLALDGDVLKNIYQHNFDRYLPNPPRTMSLAGLRAYGQSLYPRAAALRRCSPEKAAANITEALAALEL
ncbi:MAG: amidohydrolase [Spirochaetaceae bacterium]|jgi:predicted TIM-barrel fold metal-dependent hydrolase|nr:amidohydrolase [Spirochaetaceae bacterium]